MSVLTEDQLTLGIRLGGAESAGAASFSGTPTAITCPTKDLTITREAVGVDVTQRCDTVTSTKRIRESISINSTVDGDSTNGWPYGTSVDQHIELTVQDASLTAVVYVGVIRSNERGYGMGSPSRQTVRIEIRSVA